MPYAYGVSILTCGEITYQSFTLDKKNHFERSGFWGEIWDSNPRPPGPQPGAITRLANPTMKWRALSESNPRPTA